MSSIGVVVFRNSPLKPQVLQESVNNSVNITNNDNVRREIVIVRKKQKLPSNTVSVSSLVNSVENNNGFAKRPKYRENTNVSEDARSATPLAVARRNARERNRVRQVNDGFAALRRHIPEEVAAAFENANSNRGPNKKLSKVETLRMAVEYIRNLESLLNIGHTDKENLSIPSMESFPSPASSSPRENSQERSYFCMNSPALEDEDLEEDDLDSSLHKISAQQYVDLQASEAFQLVSTPRLYEEEDGNGQPLTPSSDLLAQDEMNQHLLDSHFQFPNSAEQFTVIPEQNYCSESEVQLSESDFDVKYVDVIHQQIQPNYDEGPLLDSINSELLLGQYKFKEETPFVEEPPYNGVELKKELPEIHLPEVTPEDREQFEETLKWWQEKTRQARNLSKNKMP
ncbi:achaete-scute complex protein T8-like [Pieris brassicae]|uniref:BHLH domain-containing protein n=1 Tax=Pieris brassicae TaxID=7116 RepID=A0A9P0T0X2_PIEBR|nr:achaete-scute complex protein T8-like [Pieris brassicae]CAH3993297.1 unnamed protein product [Pieris brassicae]